MSAQKARGADLESGGFMQRIKALIPIFVPLLVSSFRRAVELAGRYGVQMLYRRKWPERVSTILKRGRATL